MAAELLRAIDAPTAADLAVDRLREHRHRVARLPASRRVAPAPRLWLRRAARRGTAHHGRHLQLAQVPRPGARRRRARARVRRARRARGAGRAARRRARETGARRAREHHRPAGRAAVHTHLQVAARHAAVSRRSPAAHRQDRDGDRASCRESRSPAGTCAASASAIACARAPRRRAAPSPVRGEAG